MKAYILNYILNAHIMYCFAMKISEDPAITRNMHTMEYMNRIEPKHLLIRVLFE